MDEAIIYPTLLPKTDKRMCIRLLNEHLLLELQKPGHVYRGTRFDWTGQITGITLGRHSFCSTESLEMTEIDLLGRGLYNEFGIQQPPGYDICGVGEKFLKIGVGMLTRKTNAPYDFMHIYENTPGEILFFAEPERAVFQFRTTQSREYACQLEKEIVLSGSTFAINYRLTNLGSKEIVTHEYVHNFLAINSHPLDSQYRLEFPFGLNPGMCDEWVNPGDHVKFHPNHISFDDDTDGEFFFSNIRGENGSAASWRLVHELDSVGIEEKVDGPVESINLWGKPHVVSPEIYIPIRVEPGRYMTWMRNYKVYEF